MSIPDDKCTNELLKNLRLKRKTSSGNAGSHSQLESENDELNRVRMWAFMVHKYLIPPPHSFKRSTWPNTACPLCNSDCQCVTTTHLAIHPCDQPRPIVEVSHFDVTKYGVSPIKNTTRTRLERRRKAMESELSICSGRQKETLKKVLLEEGPSSYYQLCRSVAAPRLQRVDVPDEEIHRAEHRYWSAVSKKKKAGARDENVFNSNKVSKKSGKREVADSSPQVVESAIEQSPSVNESEKSSITACEAVKDFNDIENAVLPILEKSLVPEATAHLKAHGECVDSPAQIGEDMSLSKTIKNSRNRPNKRGRSITSQKASEVEGSSDNNELMNSPHARVSAHPSISNNDAPFLIFSPRRNEEISIDTQSGKLSCDINFLHADSLGSFLGVISNSDNERGVLSPRDCNFNINVTSVKAKTNGKPRSKTTPASSRNRTGRKAPRRSSSVDRDPSVSEMEPCFVPLDEPAKIPFTRCEVQVVEDHQRSCSRLNRDVSRGGTTAGRSEREQQLVEEIPVDRLKSITQGSVDGGYHSISSSSTVLPSGDSPLVDVPPHHIITPSTLTGYVLQTSRKRTRKTDDTTMPEKAIISGSVSPEKTENQETPKSSRKRSRSAMEKEDLRVSASKLFVDNGTKKASPSESPQEKIFSFTTDSDHSYSMSPDSCNKLVELSCVSPPCKRLVLSEAEDQSRHLPRLSSAILSPRIVGTLRVFPSTGMAAAAPAKPFPNSPSEQPPVVYLKTT